MSGLAGGQLCLVTAEILANISRRYEQEGQNRRSGCCQGEMKEKTKETGRYRRAGGVRGGHKMHQNTAKRRRVEIEMDGLGARPGLTLELSDVTRPGQRE